MNQQNGAKQGQVMQGTEIVHNPQREQATDVDVLAIVERRNAMLEKLLGYAISATHAGQWSDLGGKPWPGAAAAEVMARRCAVSIKNVQSNKVPSTDDKGPFYMYVVTATAALPGGYDTIEAMGTCSSRDTFLGTETREGRHLSDIDEGNILKAAYSNMLVNAITRLLGVRNLTWEQLERHGVHQEGAAKVSYNSGARGGGNSADATLEQLKFGPGKGQTIPQLSDAHLVHYIDGWEKDLANPEKAKFKSSTEKRLAAARAEQAKRTAAVSHWDAIRKLGRAAGLDDKAVGAQLKTLTGKTKVGELTAADVEKFSAWAKDEPGTGAIPS